MSNDKFPHHNLKRKRLQEAQSPLLATATPSLKRTRTSPPQFAIEDISGETAASGIDAKEINPIEFWTRKRRWPKEQFQRPGPGPPSLLRLVHCKIYLCRSVSLTAVVVECNSQN